MNSLLTLTFIASMGIGGQATESPSGNLRATQTPTMQQTFSPTTAAGKHFYMLTDPYVPGVSNGDVDDWAALLAMIGSQQINPENRMTIVLCDHGEERLKSFRRE